MACDRRTAGLLACVSLPAFPLQLQLLEQPQWRRYPCAIVDCDKPQGRLLWVNEKARQQRILPGMRYAAALSLACDLRAAEVSSERINQAVERLTAELLTEFSPRVEASETEPGVFWLDLTGMERLFPDLETWADRLIRRSQDKGFVSRVVVGWNRFSCYALAKGADDRFIPAGADHRFVIPAGGEKAGGGLDDASEIPAPLPTPRRDDEGPIEAGHAPARGGGTANATREGTSLSPTQDDSSGQVPAPHSHPRRDDERSILLCRSPSQERRLAAKVPLAHLGLDPAVCDALEDLGITTLGEFTQLPREGIERRFGPEVRELHQQACGARQPPLEAEEIEIEVGERVFVEQSIRELPRLMTWIELLLISSLATLAKRGELASRLTFELSLENDNTIREELRPAEPTNDRKQWLELLSLRLDSVRLGACPSHARGRAPGSCEPQTRRGEAGDAGVHRRRDATQSEAATPRRPSSYDGMGPASSSTLLDDNLASPASSLLESDTHGARNAAARHDSDRLLGEGVQEIALTLAGKRVRAGQMELFAVQPLRDLAAANRALARVRAELGGTAIKRAEIRDGHLPEAQFAWRPFKRLVEAQPARIAEATLVRRLYGRPKPLPPRPRQEPDGWLLRGLTDSPVDKVRGPFIVAGGWWRKPVHREYHYAETRDGELLWTYYDRLRRRWYLQGRLD